MVLSGIAVSQMSRTPPTLGILGTALLQWCCLELRCPKCRGHRPRLEFWAQLCCNGAVWNCGVPNVADTAHAWNSGHSFAAMVLSGIAVSQMSRTPPTLGILGTALLQWCCL